MRETEAATSDALATIIEHYGVNKQALQLCEECGELIQAVSKYIRHEGHPYERDALVEEIVDVIVVAGQFLMKFGITDETILEKMQVKISRQLDRIVKELQELNQTTDKQITKRLQRRTKQ